VLRPRPLPVDPRTLARRWRRRTLHGRNRGHLPSSGGAAPARRDGDRKVKGLGSGKAKWVRTEDGSCVKSPDDLREELLAEARQENDASLGRGVGAASSGAGPSTSAAASSHDDRAAAYGAYSPTTAAAAATSGAYTPTTTDGREETSESGDVERGIAAAARVEGLEALMVAAGMPERLPAAGTWCEEQGWKSVAHLRSGGARTADAFVVAMRLKPDGPRARRLKKEVQNDGFGWDAHASAARG